MDKDHYGTIMSIPTTQSVPTLTDSKRACVQTWIDREDRKEQREMHTLELALESGGVFGHSKKNINSSIWPWTASKDTFAKEEKCSSVYQGQANKGSVTVRKKLQTFLSPFCRCVLRWKLG